MSCGGCQGLGAHSPRCPTQPGWWWKKLYDEADSLGDSIGSSDCGAANMAYTVAARMKARWEEARRTQSTILTGKHPRAD